MWPANVWISCSKSLKIRCMSRLTGNLYMNCVQRSLYENRLSQSQEKLKLLKMWESIHKFEIYEESHCNCSHNSKLWMEEMWIRLKFRVAIIHTNDLQKFPLNMLKMVNLCCNVLIYQYIFTLHIVTWCFFSINIMQIYFPFLLQYHRWTDSNSFSGIIDHGNICPGII